MVAYNPTRGGRGDLGGHRKVFSGRDPPADTLWGGYSEQGGGKGIFFWIQRDFGFEFPLRSIPKNISKTSHMGDGAFLGLRRVGTWKKKLLDGSRLKGLQKNTE